MARYLLDDHPLNAALIHRWAYDADADLMMQDEEVLLYNWDFTDVLLAAAADPECPKASDILAVWEDFTFNRSLHQQPADIASVKAALEKAKAYARHPEIAKWIEVQSELLAYLAYVGPVGEEKALEIGGFILKSRRGSGQVTIRTRTPTHYELALSVPNSTYRASLIIEKQTGKIRYRRH